MKIKLLFIVMFLTFVNGCSQDNTQPSITSNSIDFPNADIVFNSIDEEKYEDLLGFYSEEGQTVLLNTGWNTIIPFFTNSESLVVINKKGYPGDIHDRDGNLLIFTNNRLIRCGLPETYGRFIKPHNGNIIISNSDGLNLISSKDCSVLESVLAYEDIPTLPSDFRIGSFDLSSNSEFLVISDGINLFKINLPGKEIIDYKKIGVYPSISPNQESIAYLGLDGLYLMNVDGKFANLIVPYKATLNGRYYDRGNPPKPIWSIDSKKIIYHKCILPDDQPCNNISNYAIFIYDLELKSEVLLIQNGLNPSWYHREER